MNQGYARWCEFLPPRLHVKESPPSPSPTVSPEEDEEDEKGKECKFLSDLLKTAPGSPPKHAANPPVAKSATPPVAKGTTPPVVKSKISSASSQARKNRMIILSNPSRAGTKSKDRGRAGLAH